MLTQNFFLFNLFNTGSVVCATSTREYGTIRNEDKSINNENLEKFLNNLDINPDQTVFAGQIHSSDFVNVSDAKTRLIKNVDGLITTKKNIFLCILTADCVPVLFYDYENNIIGAIHMGYKGALGGILDNVINGLKILGGNVKCIKVGIGPSIGVCCYDALLDRSDVFKRKYSDIDNVIEERDGKTFLNLKKIAVASLIKQGIARENIEISNICTKCKNDQFFSFRGGDEGKRFVTLIGLL